MMEKESVLLDKEMKTVIPKDESVSPKELGWKESLSEKDKIKIRYRLSSFIDHDKAKYKHYPFIFWYYSNRLDCN